MRHAVCASAGTLCWAALLACYLHTKYVFGTPDESAIEVKSEDSNSQIGPALYKKDWNKNLKMWGKREWGSVNGESDAERKPDAGSWQDHYYVPAESVEKRAWRNLQGGWGKRVSPDEEQLIKQLLKYLEEEEQEEQAQYISTEYTPDNELSSNDDEKRAWRQFGGGWGKRADNNWKNFRGSWGKREPAWNNLKGIWGKRSYPDRIFQ